MSESVQNIIQKINFIETDIDLQKQILAAIPSDREDEMREVIEKIARLKEKTEHLLLEIKKLDPKEYEQIKKLEASTRRFQEIAGNRNFTRVITLDHNKECEITLNDGTLIPCLVAALDESGNWTVITIDGDTREYAGEEVKS